MSNEPTIEIKHEGDITIAELLNEEILEEEVISDITDSLLGFVAENPGVKLLLSFTKVKHLSSSALGMLIRLNKHIEENGGDFKLCELRKSLYEIFVITKLNRLFDIHDDRAAALSSFEY